MASSLTGISIASSYDSLIKVGDNDGLTSSLQVLSDGLGTESGISINNTGDLTATGTITANSFVGALTGNITGNTTVSGTLTFGSLSDGTITIADFKDEDNMSSDSATALATQQSIKAYVDSQLGVQDLDFQGDAGGQQAIDLDTEVLSVVGTANEISTNSTGNALTISLNPVISGLTSVAATTFTGNLTGNVTGDVTGDLTGNSTTASNLTGTPNISVGTITAGGTITGNVTGDLTGSVTGNVTGNLTGNVTGNTSGSSGSTTGNAATATALETSRNINGTAFNGTANISFDTDAVSEGTNNLYFSEERTDDRVASLVVAGTSISKTYDDTAGTLTIANTAPDQTVALTSGTGISTAGTYPNFTITNSSPDQTVSLTDGTGITTSGTYPSFTITNSSPDQTVAFTDGEGITTSGTYPNFTIAAEDATTSNKGIASFSSSHFSVSTGAVSLATDSIDDTLIDFGTGANQVDTDVLPEGSANLYWTAERTDDQVNTLMTAGSGISLTYDDAGGTLTVASTVSGLALTDLSATDAGGDGSFSYNNGTGVFTYTGASQSEVQAHITKTYVDSLGIAATTAAGLTGTPNISVGTIGATGAITGNLTGNVTGDLTGNVTGNTSGSSGSTTGNAATATLAAEATILANARTISGVSFDGSANISLDTDDITEAANLYYTTTRWDTQLATKTSDNLTQGSTNLYNQTHSGDVTGATALTIGNDKVTTAKILDANVTTSKIADNNITTAKILDDNITTAKILDSNITTAKLANDSVTADKVASDLRAVQYIGLDSTDYMEFTDNTQIDLYINGSNEFRFEADGDFHADGDVIAYSTTTPSDERLKENVRVIENPLEKIHQLKGVTFDWIDREDKRSGGIIAQELEKVMPELVREIDSLKNEDSFKAVDYNGLIGLLIEAVKELSNKCNNCKK
jgi:hypothetical protein